MNEDSNDKPRAGLCNTPPLAYSNSSTCIDYLTFRFDVNYSDKPAMFQRLFDLMHISMQETQHGRGHNGYTDSIKLAPGIYLQYGGESTMTKDGQETSVLQMMGSGCREFEDRYYVYDKDYGYIVRDDIIRRGWLELFEELKKISGVCTRIDIPTDDMSGNISINEIKKKISNHEYTTRMKTMELTNSNDEQIMNSEDNKIQNVNVIKDSKVAGYSATFGNRKRLQLCIYDKAAEQHKKGNFLDVDNWIRYEVRYYHENADIEFNELLKNLRSHTQKAHILGRLKLAIEFKQNSNQDKRNRYKNKIWNKWEQFLQGAQKESRFSVMPKTLSIRTNAIWLKNDAAPSIGRLLGAYDIGFSEATYCYVLLFLRKADNADLQEINQCRRSQNKKPFKNIAEMRMHFESKGRDIEEISKDAMDMILHIGEKAEVLEDCKK